MESHALNQKVAIFKIWEFIINYMIGVFDSGVGGLTVLSALRELLPSADVVYFGDTKNAPYGTRSREELGRLSVHGLQFLQEHGATNIISACNSVSASLAISLFDVLSIAPKQLIEMVGPTVGYFKGSSRRLILCATPLSAPPFLSTVLVQ